MKKKSAGSFAASCLFFTFTVIWHELMLLLFTGKSNNLNIILLFSCSAGLALAFVISLIPGNRIRTMLSTVILAFLALIYVTEILLKRSFGYFYSPETIFGMAADVAGSYGGTVVSTILDGIMPVLLSIVPIALFVFFRKSILLRPATSFGRTLALGLVILLHFSAVNSVKAASQNTVSGYMTDFDYYSENFDFDQAVPRFGLCSAIRLNTVYAVSGIPNEGGQEAGETENNGAPDAPELNISDFDLAELASSGKSQILRQLGSAFDMTQATKKNSYSGIFKGKNLVFICAEALSPYAVDPVRTPILYKLMTEGFVFHNYYQPSFGESTSGGEYALLCSQIPGRSSGEKGMSMVLSCEENLRYSLPGLFSDCGYDCFGFHDNSYTYYSRNITHPRLGLNWYGVGGCNISAGYPEIDIGDSLSAGWPRSDAELIMSTSDIYTGTGRPFFTYYLTVSGHNNYSFSENTQARKNRDTVENQKGSEQVKAYLACQYELEKALSELISRLDRAGILGDTVIALSNDHYPYGLSSTWQGNGGKDHMSELAGKSLDRYERERGVFFIWNSEMDFPVTVDKPTSGFDVMPTILNLFGISYDSRLLAGRDALSDAPGLVFFSDYSFISDTGSYFSSSDKYVYRDGSDSSTFSAVSGEVMKRIKRSRQLRQSDFFKYVKRIGGA